MIIRAFLIRGLLGSVFSRGMDTLAAELNTLPGVKATTHEMGVVAYGNLSNIVQQAYIAAQSGCKIVLGGHSMGADLVLKIAHALNAKGVAVEVAACFDPTPFGCPNIPVNVVSAFGFFQTLPMQLGGHKIVPSPAFAKLLALGTRKLSFEEVRQSHVALGSNPKLRATVVAAVRAIK